LVTACAKSARGTYQAHNDGFHHLIMPSPRLAVSGHMARMC
jgi:hypothetical protein